MQNAYTKPLFFSHARTNHCGSWRSSFEFQPSSSSLAERHESSTRPYAATAAIAPVHPPPPKKN